MLYNKEFLKRLDEQCNKTTYARIEALNLDEYVVESIEGKVTSGSLNIQGTSAIRRTCNLSMIAPDVNISNYYWGLETKFRLWIGVENTIDSNYPDIIWFKQGVYLINSFSTSFSANNYTINISGKDKMCQLNGELGGIFNSQVDLGQITEEVEQGVYQTVKFPLKQVVREMVHQYGNEPFHNIIINDLDEMGLELQEYRYEDPMYLLRSFGSDSYDNAYLDGDQKCYFKGDTTLSELEGQGFIFDSLLDYNADSNTILLNTLYADFQGKGEGSPKGEKNSDIWHQNVLISPAPADYAKLFQDGVILQVTFDSANKQNSKILHLNIKSGVGQFSKMHDCPIYYQGQIVSADNPFTWSAGSTIYFKFFADGYDETIGLNYGRWAVEFPDKVYHVAKIDSGETAGYTETDLVYPDELIAKAGETICSVLDKIVKFLGDFEYFYDLDGRFVFQRKIASVNTSWSPLKTSEGENYIEDLQSASPYAYVFAGSQFFTTFNDSPNLSNLKNDFTVWGSRKSIASNADIPIHMRYAVDKKPIKYTSIEQGGKVYYANDTYVINGNSIGCDWREIIFQMAKDYRRHNHEDDFEVKIINANKDDGLYLTGRTGYEQYYIDIEGFWRQLYDPDTYTSSVEAISEIAQAKDTMDDKNATQEEKSEAEKHITWDNNYYSDEAHYPWARAPYEAPETLIFWLDFLDSAGELELFSSSAIGNRPKVVNDKDVKAIYYRGTPSIVFYQGNMEDTEQKPGYRYFNMGAYDSMFRKSTQGKSAKNEIDSLLEIHTYCTQSVTINSIPIYYLEPNTRIYVSDIQAGIEGEYIIDKISLPLTYNGTMSITAVKAVKRLM